MSISRAKELNYHAILRFVFGWLIRTPFETSADTHQTT